MKEDIVSLLSDNLIELLNYKAFKKITISKLIKQCRINRCCFYHYFRNLDSLLEYTAIRRTRVLLLYLDKIDNYNLSINFICDFILFNRYLLLNVYGDKNYVKCEHILALFFMPVLEKIIEKERRYINLPKAVIYRISEILTRTNVALLLNWLANGGDKKDFKEHFERELIPDEDDFLRIVTNVANKLEY